MRYKVFIQLFENPIAMQCKNMNTKYLIIINLFYSSGLWSSWMGLQNIQLHLYWGVQHPEKVPWI